MLAALLVDGSYLHERLPGYLPVDETLCHAPLPPVGVLGRVVPHRGSHEWPVHEVIEVSGIRREAGDGKHRVAIREYRGDPQFDEPFDGRDQVDQRLLSLGVAGHPAVDDGVQHGAAGGVVEGGVVAHHAPRSARHPPVSSLVLDAGLTDLGGDVPLLDGVGIGQQAVRGDARQVVEVGEVVEPGRLRTGHRLAGG